MIDLLLLSEGPLEDPLAARQAYRLHRQLQARGCQSQLLYRVDQVPTPEILNPEQLDGVHLAALQQPEPIHWLIQALGCRAKVGLAVGSRSFACLPPDFPYRWLLSLRVEQAQRWVQEQSGPGWPAIQKQLRSWRGFTAPQVGTECQALYAARLVLVPTPRVGQLLASLYPRLSGKIHPSPLWLQRLSHEESRPQLALRQPWSRRQLDVTLWGDDSQMTGQLQAGLKKLKVQPCIDAPEPSWELLGQTRVLLDASRFCWYQEALPRAQAMGCQVVSTLNVLNAECATSEGLVPLWTASALLERAQTMLAQGPPAWTHRPEPDPIEEILELWQAMP